MLSNEQHSGFQARSVQRVLERTTRGRLLPSTSHMHRTLRTMQGMLITQRVKIQLLRNTPHKSSMLPLLHQRAMNDMFAQGRPVGWCRWIRPQTISTHPLRHFVESQHSFAVMLVITLPGRGAYELFCVFSVPALLRNPHVDEHVKDAALCSSFGRGVAAV